MKYDVTQYGAVPNGELCTKQIQKAIDECFCAGGGEVVIPEGTFLTGGLRLRSGVTLHLLENAILLGSINPEDYIDYINDEIEPIPEEERSAAADNVMPEMKSSSSAIPYSRWNNAIIRAIHAKNVAIIGERGSEINGQNCFDEKGEENYRGPHAVNMWYCENINLSGYTIRDSANWAHAIQNSRGISVCGVTVLGGHDGFDVRTCDDISIKGCRFLTGDDGIAGFDNVNVSVSDCYFESACSIFRFGATNMIVDNCIGVAPTTYGYRGSLSDEEKKNRVKAAKNSRRSCLGVFFYYCDYRANIRSTPGNIVIRNSSFKNPDAMLTLPFGHKWCCNRSLDNITFENCTVIGRDGYDDINLIEGKNVAAIELYNLTLKNLYSPKIVCDENTVISQY